MRVKIKNCLTALSVLVILLFATVPAMAQKRTDAQIGFDREKVRANISGESKFIKKEFIESEVDRVRARMESDYNAYQTFSVNNPFTQIPESGCDNMSFDDNTQGWALYYSNNTYNGNDLLSDNNTPNTFSTLGNSGLPSFGNNRITVVNRNTTDVVFTTGVTGGNLSDKIVRLGFQGERYIGREEIAKKIELTPENSMIKYSYAVVLNDASHDITTNPFFKVTITMLNDYGPVTLPSCISVKYNADSANGQGFKPKNGVTPAESGGTYYYKDWTTNIIDFSQYVDLNTHPVVTISFSISDCNANGNFHEAWAYVEAGCTSSENIIATTNNAQRFCTGGSNTFHAPGAEVFIGDVITWTIYQDNNNSPLQTQTSTVQANSANTGTFTYPAPGVYRIEYKINRGGCIRIYNHTIVVADCICIDCTSFNPEPGKKYIISAWVCEKTTGGNDVQDEVTYTFPFIKLTYLDVGLSPIETLTCRPGGDIIDGWQRISAEFIMPDNIDDLVIELDNGGSPNVTYFDDVRVFPYNSSMKSFVYDQETQRLMSELDESNYATFYEYDNEGGLIRVKKETVNGVKTIKETRSGNKRN